MRLPALALALLLPTLPLHADDGAASIAAGGIVLMKREPRIVMAKEVLQIGPDKVVVDYDFRNDSGQDITTVVAFPVPPYTFGEDEGVFGDPAFDDFQLTVNGQPVTFRTEARAFVEHRDITSLLTAEHIDIASFGHWDNKAHDYDDPGADFKHATPAAKRRLLAAGAYDHTSPNWKVQKKYYWSQTFPAHATVHIQHRYSPALGGSNSLSYGLRSQSELTSKTRHSKDEQSTIDEVESMCLDPQLRASMLKMTQQHKMVPYNYVDFILTTANTWKTPIEDFTLIVERPDPSKTKAAPATAKPLVSFCWAGPVEKTDANHFTAHLTNFVPSKELRVGFLYPEDVSTF